MGGAAWDVGRPFGDLPTGRRAFCGVCQHQFVEGEDVLPHMDSHVDPDVRREREREMGGDLQEMLGELRG
jgi:hypothetical protein